MRRLNRVTCLDRGGEVCIHSDTDCVDVCCLMNPQAEQQSPDIWTIEWIDGLPVGTYFPCGILK